MERLTNNYSDLIEEVKKELFSLDVEMSEDCILNYSEIPWFAGGQFSIFILYSAATGRYRISEKKWDSQYDCERFSSGVYNLERLRIEIKIIELSNQHRRELESLISELKFVPDTLERDDYILLNGIEYTLNIKMETLKKNYKWKVATEDLQYFIPLIDFIKTQLSE